MAAGTILGEVPGVGTSTMGGRECLSGPADVPGNGSELLEFDSGED